MKKNCNMTDYDANCKLQLAKCNLDLKVSLPFDALCTLWTG